MSLVRVLGLGVALIFVTAVGAQDRKSDKLDPARIVGTYKVTGGMQAGMKFPEDKQVGAITFTKDTITIKGKTEEETFVFSYKLDTTKTPAHIDMKITSPEALKGAEAKGIIEYGKGTLRLCYHPSEGERPTKFESTEKNGTHLWTMTREDKGGKGGKRKKKDDDE